MKKICLLMCVWGLSSPVLSAQLSWLGGRVFASPPRSFVTSGEIGLVSVVDRDWLMGVSAPWKNSKNSRLGVFLSARWRSPFYELNAALPYYERRAHVPTFRLETISLYPFLSCSGIFASSKRMSWMVRVGPVFEFHSGNFISTTTARSALGQSPFVLYQLSVKRQPLAIPYGRLQMGVTYPVLKRSGSTWFLQPFIQWDVADRSRVYFKTLPDDLIHRSEGFLKNRNCSVGFVCGFGRRR